jgi:hypothetical protein
VAAVSIKSLADATQPTSCRSSARYSAPAPEPPRRRVPLRRTVSNSAKPEVGPFPGAAGIPDRGLLRVSVRFHQHRIGRRSYVPIGDIGPAIRSPRRRGRAATAARRGGARWRPSRDDEGELGWLLDRQVPGWSMKEIRTLTSRANADATRQSPAVGFYSHYICQHIAISIAFTIQTAFRSQRRRLHPHPESALDHESTLPTITSTSLRQGGPKIL